MSVAISPVRSRDGEVTGASAVARDITERKLAEVARAQIAHLEQAQAGHRVLIERVFEAQEEERRRIAPELHDEAGQLMASLLVGLRALEDVDAVAQVNVQAQRLRQIAVQAIDEVGRLARGLHTSILDDLGLASAVRRLAADFEQTHRIHVELALDDTEMVDVAPSAQLALFRIIQEALTNVARHAGASEIHVNLFRSATTVTVTITDNGVGFAVDSAIRSDTQLGLHSMRERAAILNGTLDIRSGAAGTNVIVELPVRSSPLKSPE